MLSMLYNLYFVKAVIIYEVYSFIQVFSVNAIRTQITSYLPFRPSWGYMSYMLGKFPKLFFRNYVIVYYLGIGYTFYLFSVI